MSNSVPESCFPETTKGQKFIIKWFCQKRSKLLLHQLWFFCFFSEETVQMSNPTVEDIINRGM